MTDRRHRSRIGAHLLALAVIVWPSAPDAGLSPPMPAVDPAEAGPSLPPIGRSLFDFLTMRETQGGRTVQEVPFPFTALIARLEGELERGRDPPLKKVLIPIGRSLQRNAANPDFFAYPRVVVAVDGGPAAAPGASGMLLRDRLYLGYQEKAATLEVISYNEAAGRFEFQIVRDYRPGGAGEVVYADRPTCIACHQNHAPIFSKPLWDETNANAAVAATLSTISDAFYGIPARGGVDLTNAFDFATDRANEFAALQRVWQDGCAVPDAPTEAIACRADILLAVLRYRLAGNRLPAAETADWPFAAVLASQWRRLWPGGLAIPDPDVPNRVALTAPLDARVPLSEADAVRLSTVELRFEPFEPRPPREVWYLPEAQPELIPRLIAGLSWFLAVPDIRRLDALLRQEAAPTVRYRGACRMARADLGGALTEYRFRCDAREQAMGVAMRGHVQVRDGAVVGGSVSPLRVGGQPDLANLRVARGAFERTDAGVGLRVELEERSAGLHARLPDGNAIRGLEIVWPDADEAAGEFGAEAMATVADDFAAVVAAVQAMRERASDALTARPLRRVALMRELFAELGAEPVIWCCLDDGKLPPARLE